MDLLEYAVAEKIAIDLLTDQTSCHVAHSGGYCPQGLTFAERTALLSSDRKLSARWWTKAFAAITSSSGPWWIAAFIFSITAMPL